MDCSAGRLLRGVLLVFEMAAGVHLHAAWVHGVAAGGLQRTSSASAGGVAGEHLIWALDMPSDVSCMPRALGSLKVIDVSQHVLHRWHLSGYLAMLAVSCMIAL